MQVSGRFNKSRKIPLTQRCNTQLFLLYSYVFVCNYTVSHDPLHYLFSVSCISLKFKQCVSGFTLGIGWPEGGSSTNAALGKEKFRQTRFPPLCLHKCLLDSFSFFSALCSIYLHCADRLLSLIEKHDFAPATSFICEHLVLSFPSVLCTFILNAQQFFFSIFFF